MKLIDWARRNTFGLCPHYELERKHVPYEASGGFFGLMKCHQTTLIFIHKCNHPKTNVKHIMEDTDCFCTMDDWKQCPLNKTAGK